MGFTEGSLNDGELAAVLDFVVGGEFGGLDQLGCDEMMGRAETAVGRTEEHSRGDYARRPPEQFASGLSSSQCELEIVAAEALQSSKGFPGFEGGLVTNVAVGRTLGVVTRGGCG